jgi:hypothetical protein
MLMACALLRRFVTSRQVTGVALGSEQGPAFAVQLLALWRLRTGTKKRVEMKEKENERRKTT